MCIKDNISNIKNLIIAFVMLLGINLIFTTRICAVDTTIDSSNFEQFFSINSNAKKNSKDPSIIDLTQDEQNQAGSISLKNRINLKANFTLNAKINLGNKIDSMRGGDGIGFAFHPDDVGAVGYTGANMGIGGLKNAIGFKLDTYRNTAYVGSSTGDDNHKLGWEADPGSEQGQGNSGKVFGTFVTTNETKGYVSMGKNEEKYIDSNVMDNQLRPIIFDYTYNSTSGEGTIAVTYNNQYTWSYTVSKEYIDKNQTVTFAVSASTGDNHNLQQIQITSFKYDVRTKLTLKKVWVDNGNSYNNRPDKIYYQVFQNGQPYEKIELSSGNTSGNSWEAVADNLPVYNNNNWGEYKYTVKEDAVPGYTASEPDYSVAEAATITNTLNDKDITLKKVWIDSNNSDGLRPESITVYIHLLDNTGNELTKLETTLKESDTVNGSAWSKKIQIPAYVDKQEVKKIKITESIGTVPYTLTSITPNYSDDIPANGEYTITNSQLTSVTVLKQWIDLNNLLGIRPATITVKLYKNDSSVENNLKNLDDANNWTGTWSDLVKYDNNGQLIEYTVKESVVPESYSTTISSGVITNTITGIDYHLTLTKEDANGNSLAGATFKLAGTNVSGTNVSSTTESTAVGLISFDQKLSPGTYTITETKAPAGYKKNNEVISFTINDDYSITSNSGLIESQGPDTTNKKYNIVFNNVKNDLKAFDLTITKKGVLSSNLKGAIFKIEGQNAYLNTGTTDDEGKLSFSTLTPGTYTLTEETAPEGYMKLTKPIKVDISDKGKVILTDPNNVSKMTNTLSDGDASNEIQIEIKNNLKGVLPATGGNGKRAYVLGATAVATLAVLVGGVYVYRNRKGGL